MFQRQLDPLLNRSFFLFGARGTGKTTWLQKAFSIKNALWIDLLDEEVYEDYSITPKRLDNELNALAEAGRLPKFVIIDEIQRVPGLLNIVQIWIQKKKLIFVLTGSSARKLKRGGANLLGGRANYYELYNLSANEIGSKFDLNHALSWGTLPEMFEMQNDREKKAYLKSYCNTYLKEEVLIEQLIRKLPPFRKFLNILSQNNGKEINYEKFSRDTGVDNKTIQSYLEILEETYLGVILRPHHPSLRKSQIKSPKFYFFDTGVVRQLAGYTDLTLKPSTSLYGDLFESFLINEILKTVKYKELEYELSFFKTKHNFEVDLILSKNSKRIFVEIKSTNKVDQSEVRKIENGLGGILGNKDKIFYLSQDKKEMKIGSVSCLYYLDFINSLN